MKCQFSGFPLGTVKKIKHPVEDLKDYHATATGPCENQLSDNNMLINVQTTKSNLTGPV